MKKNIGLWILACGVIFAACERLDMVGMFAGSSPNIDQRWEVSQAYNQQAGFATINALTDDYHVYVCTDTHIHKTRTRWEYFIKSYRADMLCPVAVHLGDIIVQQPILNMWKMPWSVIHYHSSCPTKPIH